MIKASDQQRLFNRAVAILEEVRTNVVRAVNSNMVIAYWLIGREMVHEQGYDAFVPLVDSGISVSLWNNAKLVSVFIHSCKQFNEARATQITKEYFRIKTIEAESL